MRNLLILAAVGIAAYFIWNRWFRNKEMTNFEKQIDRRSKAGLRKTLVSSTKTFNTDVNAADIRRSVQNADLTQAANSEQGNSYNGIEGGDYHVSLNYL